MPINVGSPEWNELLERLENLDLYNNQIEDSSAKNLINSILERNKYSLIQRRDRFIYVMLVLTRDVDNSNSQSLWRTLPQELRVMIIRFIHFHPWESIGKTPQQIHDCAEYMLTHATGLNASLKEAIKTRQAFKIVENLFDRKTHKFPFFFPPQPASSIAAEYKTIHEPPSKNLKK